MALQLGLDVSQAGPLTVVALHGELDAATAADLEALSTLLAGSGATEVALDLADLGFVDSNGVRAILALRDRFVQAGGDLFLVRPSRLLLHIVKTIGGQVSVLSGASSKEPAART